MKKSNNINPVNNILLIFVKSKPPVIMARKKCTKQKYTYEGII